MSSTTSRRDFFGSAVPGKQVRILQRPGRQDSGWGQRLSGRALRSTTPYHRTMIMAVPEFAAFSSDMRRLGAMSGANGSPLRLRGPRDIALSGLTAVVLGQGSMTRFSDPELNLPRRIGDT